MSLPENNGALVYNDLYKEFDTLDIDGNLEDWAQRNHNYGELNLTQFRLPLLSYLDSMGEHGNKTYLLEQLLKLQPDRLENYLTDKPLNNKTNTIWINSTQKK